MFYQSSGVIYDDKGKVRSVSRSFKNIAAAQTDAEVVAAVAGYKIRVLAMTMSPGATATAITFNSKPAGAGTAISALFANAANATQQLGHNPHGWFETNVGEGLSATTGAGSATGLTFAYALVK